MRIFRTIPKLTALLGLLFAGLGVARSFHTHVPYAQSTETPSAHGHDHSHQDSNPEPIPFPGSSNEHCAICHLIADGAKAALCDAPTAIAAGDPVDSGVLAPAISLPHPPRLDAPSQRAPPIP